MRVLPYCLVTALASMPARAADFDQSLTDPTPAKGWIISLGGSVQFAPRFDGARSAGISGLPSLSWRKIGEPEAFSAPDDGLDYALYETDRFSAGVVGNVRAGRYSSSDRRLFGLRDVPWTVEAGAFAEFWPILDRLRTRIELRQGFHGHHGLVADLSADWVERFGKFTFAVGPRLSLGSASFMRRNFGISPQEAALNGWLTAYRPSGGAKSAGLAASVEYAWNPTWSTMLFARYDRMLGEALRSPIVRTIGSRDQFTVGVGVTYSFEWKS